MKNLKCLLILLLSLLLSFQVACKEKDPEEEWKNKIADYIEEVEETTSIAYEYDEFELSMIRIKVTYTDGTSREIPLTQDMLSERDYNKLFKVGQPRIEVWYMDCEPIKFTIKFIDSAMLDQNLNEKKEYGTVIKAIRKDNTIEFIVEPNLNTCAFQFQYTFDNTIMQVSNPVNGKENGIYSIELGENTIKAMIVLDETIETETVLFTVSFEGNFRTSKLAIDTNFDNKCYTNTGNYIASEIEKVLYHASVK